MGVIPLLNTDRIKAIDFGCGTGFMIDLLVDLVDWLTVSISLMLDRVNVSSGKVSTLGLAEHTPFDQCSFHLATLTRFSIIYPTLNHFWGRFIGCYSLVVSFTLG